MIQPHQQRVIDEKKELDEKATKLSDFIGHSPTFDTLDPAEQERLKIQNDIMWQYSEILGARIADFTDDFGKDDTKQLVNWQVESPTEPGWYWFKGAYDDPAARILRVFNRPGHSYLCIFADNMYLYPNDNYLSVNKLDKVIWAGPLAEPN